MKTATLPAVRVTPDLRHLAEAVLKDGETLSMFVEDSVRKQAQMREEDRVFYARGLASMERVRAGEKTYTVAEVMQGLRASLGKKRKELAAKAAQGVAKKQSRNAVAKRRKTLA
jgi:hypothetical protein